MSGTVTATTAASSTTSSSSSARLAENFDTFLTLLTTQLQNQSPTDPLDANEMTAQLVQFASVEQQMRMNTTLESLVSLQQASALTAAAPLLGRQVEVESDSLALQNGIAELRLPDSGSSTSARVQVLDSAGRTLREATVTLGSGATSWRWDGRDGNGTLLADGAYRVAVTGAGTTDTTARALPFTVLGTATGAEQQDGAVSLALGGLTIGFDKLRRIVATE